MFNLMGGEPLLRYDFANILEHILKKDVICDVNTNCFLVPKYLDVLKQTSQIFTSVDGDEHAHDLNRGKGSYEKTLRGIIAARKAGIPVRINCTITRHNTEKIDFLIDLCEKHNLFLTFTPLVRVRDVLHKRATSLYLNDREAKETFLRIKKAKKATNRILNSDASLDFFINYPVALDKIVRRDETGKHADYYDKLCPYGRFQFFVISNGDVFPCHNMWNEPSFLPKNILSDGMCGALLNAGKLWCKYCWLANLVEWNQSTSLNWLIKGALMTLKQVAVCEKLQKNQEGTYS